MSNEITEAEFVAAIEADQELHAAKADRWWLQHPEQFEAYCRTYRPLGYVKTLEDHAAALAEYEAKHGPLDPE